MLLPKIQKYKAIFYNVDELKELLACCDDDAPIKPIILISLGFGLKDIQEWLGHSDITVTGNIYAHLETRRKIEMAQCFADKMAL